MQGKRFERLVVLQWDCGERSKCKSILAEVQCDCGNIIKCRRRGLIKGKPTSCGCLRRENQKTAATSHGLSGTSEYRSWHAMKNRCDNPNWINYQDYGGKGIGYCDRWKDVRKFVDDMGPRPDGYSLDRIDGSLGYCPDNCRWATRKQQNRNQSRARILEYNGEKKCLSEWIEVLHLSRDKVKYRLNKGIDFTTIVNELRATK